MRAMCWSLCESIAWPISPRRPDISPAPKIISVAIPFAIGARKTEPASATAETMTMAAASSMPGDDDAVRGPAAGPVGDPERREVDDEDVEHAHSGRADEAGEQELRATDRPDDERLQEPGLSIATHDVQGQEHREHRAEEQDREHREPEDDRSRERLGVEIALPRPDEPAGVLERLVRPVGVQREEESREHEHDGEHLPAQALAQPVEDDRRQSTTSR